MNERAYNSAYIAMAVSLKFREDIDMVCRVAQRVLTCCNSQP